MKAFTKKSTEKIEKKREIQHRMTPFLAEGKVIYNYSSLIIINFI